MLVADLDKENRKGKGKVVEPEAADEGEDDEDSDAEDDGNDMQLAWEMLELAKLCYSPDASVHKQQLAGGLCQSAAMLRSLIPQANSSGKEGLSPQGGPRKWGNRVLHRAWHCSCTFLRNLLWLPARMQMHKLGMISNLLTAS